ncbi:Hpt domain-containing protein [Sulfitobacter sp.]|uniref:Hpt domain-containing protein n=1 Tax=Sulfitobacter sp. TaxID=1903071 RepID=UPI003298CD88
MINWKMVWQLREDVGKDDFSEVVEIFIEEVSATIHRLRHTPDIKTLGADLHALKGSALNLGFTEFSDLCQAGETLAAQGKADQIVLLPILDSYDVSKDALIAGLKQRA